MTLTTRNVYVIPARTSGGTMYAVSGKGKVAKADLVARYGKATPGGYHVLGGRAMSELRAATIAGDRLVYKGKLERKPQRASLARAVAWIAENDESAELRDVQAVALQISVALVADLFGKHEIDIAGMVLHLRHNLEG